MEICVCVKQVPDISRITIDKATNTLVRTDMGNVMNSFDEYAIKAGLMLKERLGGSITVLSMGPESAKHVLSECLAYGADKAFLLSDSSFAGADTLATGYTLSMAIKEIQKRLGSDFDIVICGQQSIDGETAQVGAELAELLDLPQVTGVYEIEECAAEESSIIVKRARDFGYERIKLHLPGLITVSRMTEGLKPPSLKEKLAAKRREIEIFDAAKIPDLKPESCGVKGSKTTVKKTYVFDSSIEKTEMFNGLNDKALSELWKILDP